jgi:MoaA/NifB/PqqE/SkfB family radical SAM enzyme
MITPRAIQGLGRLLFLARLKLTIFAHYLPLLLRGDLPPRRFVLFLRRLLLFLSKLGHNKFVRLGRRTRLDLYVPSFPSLAFYVGCRKFLAFDQPTPCSTVLLSLTSACRFACPHCYQRHDRGKDFPIDNLLQVIRRLQDNGIAFFNLEGGEPFLVYERLRKACAAIDARSEVWVNSTGDGMTLERLRELKGLNLTAIMFSLHTAEPARLNAFMQSPQAWDTLARGIGLCHAADLPVTFNTCLQREGFYNGEFERLMEQAKAFGACLIQLIKPKAAGAWLESAPATFDPQDLAHVAGLVKRYNHDPACAAYPAIAAQTLIEDPARFGCTAGGTDRFYINAKGDVQPCEFLNLSFGNLAEEDFDTIYARMRRAFDPPGETWLCEACAPQIRAAFQEHKAPTLPLDKETSAQIYSHWDRGRPTRLYAEVEKLK